VDVLAVCRAVGCGRGGGVPAGCALGAGGALRELGAAEAATAAISAAGHTAPKRLKRGGSRMAARATWRARAPATPRWPSCKAHCGSSGATQPIAAVTVRGANHPVERYFVATTAPLLVGQRVRACANAPAKLCLGSVGSRTKGTVVAVHSDGTFQVAR
jgi:hypothetical protein